LQFPIYISPDSEYLPHDLEHETYDRLLNRKHKIQRD
jgi:hypothetical protein